jgi:hypothetical protein
MDILFSIVAIYETFSQICKNLAETVVTNMV